MLLKNTPPNPGGDNRLCLEHLDTRGVPPPPSLPPSLKPPTSLQTWTESTKLPQVQHSQTRNGPERNLGQSGPTDTHTHITPSGEDVCEEGMSSTSLPLQRGFWSKHRSLSHAATGHDELSGPQSPARSSGRLCLFVFHPLALQPCLTC